MFHCLVIKVSIVFDSSFTLSHLFELVKNFFQVFSKLFSSMCCCRLFADDLFTLSCIQSFVNYFFIFLKNFLFFIFSETIISDSSIRLPQEDTSVNNFFHFFQNRIPQRGDNATFRCSCGSFHFRLLFSVQNTLFFRND